METWIRGFKFHLQQQFAPQCLAPVPKLCQILAHMVLLTPKALKLCTFPRESLLCIPYFVGWRGALVPAWGHGLQQSNLSLHEGSCTRKFSDLE